MKHSINIRVYYEDTDAGGIVYHANPLKFAERGRTEFLRHVGYENRTLEMELGVIFVVRRIEIDYLTPSFLDDSLVLESTIKELKNTSFIMHQRLVRPHPGRQEIIADLNVVLVCVDTKTYKPTRLPENVKGAFQAYQEKVQ